MYLLDINPSSYSYGQYDTAGDRVFDICLRLQSLRRDTPRNYELLKNLIKFGHKLIQKGRVNRSAVSSVLKEFISSYRSHEFFIDNYEKLFVDGDLSRGGEIINKCKSLAYGTTSNRSEYFAYHKTFYDDGYDLYVVKKYSYGTLPNYEGFYSQYLKDKKEDRYQRHSRYAD